MGQKIICDGCNVRHPHEHKCHGQDCQCDNPTCMNYQGRLSDQEYKKMVDDFISKISKGEEKSTPNTPSFLEALSEFGEILDHADKAKK